MFRAAMMLMIVAMLLLAPASGKCQTTVTAEDSVTQIGVTTAEVEYSDADIIAEKDWTGVEDDDLPWIQFAGEESIGFNGSAAADPEGIAITVNEKSGLLWQPQANVLEDFDLEADGNYRVEVVAKLPCDGQLQINLGDWNANYFLYDFPIEATGDFQVITCDFLKYGGDASNSHVLFQCGDFIGTSIVKSVKVINLDTSGIKGVKYIKPATSAVYNLNGQKVEASYKGIVIRNGKKFLQK